MSAAKSTLTPERLKELFLYDPESGIFTRRIAHGRHGRYRAGVVAGSADNKGYIVIRIDKRIYKAHRLAWLYVHGEWPQHDIDHINRVKSDNRISNLRDAPATLNRLNMVDARKDSKLGVLGVYQRGKMFVAQIQVIGKGVKYLGTYPTKEQASAVYEKTKEDLYAGAVLVREPEAHYTLSCGQMPEILIPRD